MLLGIDGSGVMVDTTYGTKLQCAMEYLCEGSSKLAFLDGQ